MASNGEGSFICNKCSLKLSSNYSLKRHCRLMHGDGALTTKMCQRLICPQNDCSLKFRLYTELRQHILMVHGVSIEHEDLKFGSMEDFENWRYETQNKTSSEYIKDKASVTLCNGDKKIFLHCCRSYKDKMKPERKRSLKSQGSKKIGKACPSTIEIIERANPVNGKVHVKFYKTHCGHSLDLGHLRIDQRCRNEIAGKLRDGVALQRIIDDIRDGPSTSTRLKLLARQDLHNIIRDKNVSYDTKRHQDDATSVALWVADMNRLGDDNPVLLYKPSGSQCPNTCLKENDFALIIMTKFQSMQLNKFGNSKICVDGTHGTNPYDIQLYTVLTIDEFGGGCPVAFCFSNRGDEELLSLYFEQIREKVGVIETNVFMSDNAPAFSNAWSVVMGKPKHKLLCSWHVEKCWQKNLSKIKGNKKNQVYKTLKVLLEMTGNIADFTQALDNTRCKLLNDPDTKLFGEYFSSYYVSKPECWAYCYRAGLGLNTNNHLESFHKNLKYLYLDGKKVTRMDKTINALLKVARDSLFQRIIKLTKQTPNQKITNVHKSHAKSSQITSDMIEEQNGGSEWVVKSSSLNLNYLVSKQQETCTDLCIRCIPCNICIHSYTCTCTDNVIKLNICKHIHACTKQIHYVSDYSFDTSAIVTSEVDSLMNIAGLESDRSFKPKEQLKLKITHLLSLIEEQDNSINFDSIDKCVDRAISIAKCTTSTLTTIVKTNANQKIEKQSNIFPKKKKSQVGKNTIGNPTVNERRSIMEEMVFDLESTVNVHSGNDHSYFVG